MRGLENHANFGYSPTTVTHHMRGLEIKAKKLT